MTLIRTPSTTLSRALRSANSTATEWADSDRGYCVLSRRPEAKTNDAGVDVGYPYNPGLAVKGDGFYRLGDEGSGAPNRLILLPFSEGEPGYGFVVRLYELRRLVGRPDAAANGPEGSRELWLCCLRSELLCSTADRPVGLSDDAGGRWPLSATERLCDSVQITSGPPGDGPSGTGGTVSTYPDQIAYAVLPLSGPQMIAFDFRPADSTYARPMNALWAVC